MQGKNFIFIRECRSPKNGIQKWVRCIERMEARNVRWDERYWNRDDDNNNNLKRGGVIIGESWPF